MAEERRARDTQNRHQSCGNSRQAADVWRAPRRGAADRQFELRDDTSGLETGNWSPVIGKSYLFLLGWGTTVPRGKIRFACLMRWRLILRHSVSASEGNCPPIVRVVGSCDSETAAHRSLRRGASRGKQENGTSRESREMQMQVDSGSWRGMPNLARRVN